MKRGASPEATPKRYSAAELTREQKDMVGDLYDVWVQRGWQRDDFLSFFSDAGYGFSKATLSRWVRGVRASEPPSSAERGSGRPAALSSEQERDVVGFVLVAADLGLPVRLRTVVSYLRRRYGFEVSEATVWRLMRRNALAKRVRAKSTAGLGVSIEAQIDLYVDAINKWEGEGHLDGLFACFDVTYVGAGKSQQYYWGPKGSAPLRPQERSSAYTDAVYTLLWSDGKNHTPALAFTSNPAFKPGAWSEEACKFCFSLKVDRSRIYFVEDAKKYVRESKDGVATFFRDYQIAKDIVVFSDNGHAFYREGVSLLRDVGLEHQAIPAAVHHFISPNDNAFHRTVKSRLAAHDIGPNEGARRLITFLHECDQVMPTEVEGYFDQNFFLQKDVVEREDVHKIIAPHGKNMEVNGPFYEECKDIFKANGGEAFIQADDPIPLELQTGLDGVAWK